MITINTALKKIRRDAGLSQVQLASRMKCSKNTVQAMEGKVYDPKWSQIAGWLQGCKAPASSLFTALFGPGGTSELTPVADEAPSEVVLGFTGALLRRATVRRVGVRVALIDVAEGNAVVQAAANYDELLEGLPSGVEVFERLER